MSLTEKTYDRFWKSMGERYGKRWLDNYGDAPTFAWRELLKSYTPKEIESALNLLPTRKEVEHPPSEPEFKILLTRATRQLAHPTDEPAQFRRAYWRSSIVAAVEDAMGYRYDQEGFEQLLKANKTSLGAAMRELLDDADELEANTGQRTRGQHDMVERRAGEIAMAFRALRKAVA